MARTNSSWLLAAAALTTALALAADPRDAEACSCLPPPSAAVALAGADAVFEARAATVSTAGAGASPIASTGGEIQVSFAVLRAWKGAGIEAGREVKLSTAAGGGACGFGFQQGETYIVYASLGRDGGLRTSICTRTKRSRDAGDELAALDAAVAGGGGTPSGSPSPADAGGSPPTSGSSGSGASGGEPPPFEGDSSAPAVVTPAGAPPPPPPNAPPSGGCAGCAVPAEGTGALGGLAAAIGLGLGLILRRVRRSSAS